MVWYFTMWYGDSYIRTQAIACLQWTSVWNGCALE